MTAQASPKFRVLEATTSQQVQDQLDVRRYVFVEEQDIPLENEFEPLDDEMLQQPTHPDAIVLVAYAGEQAVGCVRLLKKKFGYKLGRLAVRQEFRGQGCGRIILEKAHEVMGDALIVVHVQVHVQGMYTKFGYKVADYDIFYEEGIAHIKMFKGNLVEGQAS